MTNANKTRNALNKMAYEKAEKARRAAKKAYKATPEYRRFQELDVAAAVAYSKYIHEGNIDDGSY